MRLVTVPSLTTLEETMDDNYTILLILKDRSHYTLRLMRWMDILGYPFKILVADGGEDKVIQEILENSANFPNLKYDYLRYPHDDTLDQFHEKMADSIDKIETPLASVVDNDDFFFLQGVVETIQFLKDNEGYSSSRGAVHPAYLSEDMGGELYLEENMYSKYKDSIIGSSAAERMIDQTKHFHGNWHNTTRSNHLKACWKMINVIKPKNMRFTEQITGYLNTLWGNGHRGEYPWIIHQNGQRIQMPDGDLASHFPEQTEWINSEYWVEEFAKMTELMGVAIAAYDGIPVKDAMKLFADTYPTKVQGLEKELKEKVEKSREIGYNAERIKKMFDIVAEYDIKKVEPVPGVKFSYPNVEQEEQVLRSFLASIV